MIEFGIVDYLNMYGKRKMNNLPFLFIHIFILKKFIMPSKSKSQQRFFGMVDAYKKGEMKNASNKIKKAANGMSMNDIKDFAETKHKGLPNKVKENKTMNKKLIRLTEGDLHRIVKESVYKILKESQFMSDEDIANQYSDMKITYFEMNPLKYHNGWRGAFELEFPNADGIDYDETMVNDFMVYDRMGNQIAWEKWMPDEQRKRLEEIIRQEIAKRNY